MGRNCRFGVYALAGVPVCGLPVFGRCLASMSMVFCRNASRSITCHVMVVGLLRSGVCVLKMRCPCKALIK